MSEYLWIGSAGDHDFGDGNNWIDTSNGTPGEPGSADVAVVETSGPLTGSGTVDAVDLISSGGTLTTQTLGISATSLTVSGSLVFGSATQFYITDNAVQVGTSTIVQNAGSSLTISGSDGTAGDVVTAMTFGTNSGDNVAYTLTGLSTLLDATDGNLVIGGGGTASVTVSGGATLEADNENADGSGNVSVGGASGAAGTLTVAGAYSTLELAGALEIGAGGTGHFVLSNGADAELGQDFDPASGSVAMVVGSAAGGVGTAVISGAGTRLASNVYSAVTVGSSGTGTMSFSAGATGNFGLLQVGIAATGAVTVQGVGTTLQLHEAAIIGDYSTGTLQVLAGAHMALTGNGSDTLTIGSQDGATGTLIISGTGSLVNADNDQVQIGYFGTGHAAISSGGTLVAGAPTSSASHAASIIGTEDGSVGTATVQNAGSVWTAHGEFDVGFFGKGTLMILAGGAVSSGNYNGVVGFIAGNQAGSSGTATVSGAGSKLTNSGRFIIGEAGTGSLAIGAGAAVTTSLPAGSTQDGAIIGDLSGGAGQVSVSGTGTTWSIGTDLVVGNAGTGKLTIGAGATVKAASLSTAVTAAGTLSLSGASATLAVTGNAQFGTTATATVTVGSGSTLTVGGAAELKDGHISLAGGALTVTQALTVDAGQAVGGSGTVKAGSIINAGALQANGGTLSFTGGITGTGLLQVLNGATLRLAGAVGAGERAQFNAAAGNLTLGAAASFAGTISNFVKGDTIDLSAITAASLTYASQTLTVHESGGASLALKFTGAYTQASFAMASDQQGGTAITHT